ncbi:MAG TPA: hypothetical protein VEC14_16880, partial [Reyranellaceae bacterium]|nr:hypothetical protein [Reyranellaceae bacterium]
MGTIIIEGFPEQEEKKESWLADDSPDAIRADEMFARQLDNELADELHALQAGLVAKSGEDALAAIGELSPTMAVLKQRYLAQALGERQKGLIAPLIDQRIEQMGRAVGGIARRATQEVDDETVQRRLDGFRRDAALVSDDWQQLRTLGRATAAELRYLGERRDWNRTETETRVVAAVGNLYAGAVEAAIDRDPDKAAALYDHARSVIAPERQVDLERRFAMAREDRLVREIDRVLGANLPDPEAPPTAEALSARAAELTPDNASEELRGRIAATVAAAQRRLDRRREKQHATAGLAALEWLGSNPDASQLLLPSQVRRWLAADQLEALDAFAERGRLATNDEVFNHLEKLMVYEPSAFAALELARHRLSLDEADYKRFRNAQLAIESSSPDAAVVRTRHARVETDRALLANGI